MQVTVKQNTWGQITSSTSAKLHIKVPYFSKVYYVESNDDPNTVFPNPTDADEIKIIVSPNHAAGYVNLEYTSSGNGPLYMYSTNCDIYVIVE